MNYKRLIRDIIVAVLTAILTYLTSSCAGGIVMGNRTSLSQDVKYSADSSRVDLPAITIH